MFRMNTRDNKPTAVIKSIILYFRSCPSERKADINLHFLSWYLKRISLEALSSHICCISCIPYLISLEDSVHGRLINPFSRNTFYSPREFSCTHLWHLTSKSTYLFFQIRRCSVVYIESHASIRESFWFRSWRIRYQSSISIHTKTSYPLGYTLTRHSKTLCYFCNRPFLLNDISYRLYLHSNILVTLESRSHRWDKIHDKKDF